MSSGLSPGAKVEAAKRILRGENPVDVARDLGLTPEAVSRATDDLIEPEDLKPFLASIAAEFDLVGRVEFPFAVGVGSKIYIQTDSRSTLLDHLGGAPADAPGRHPRAVPAIAAGA